MLRHCSRALLHGIHSVFPPPAISGHNGEDPISIKKLLEKEGLWEVRKEVLGWVFDGATRCIELAESKQEKIMAELKAIVRINDGVPLKRFQKLVGKLRHAAIGVPAGKALFGPLNRLVAEEPKQIFWARPPEAKAALKDWRRLLQQVIAEPTHVKELVAGEADYVGTLDASGTDGCGGVWLPGKRQLAPIVWRFPWPQEVKDRLVTFANPNGDITNSDLELVAELMGLLILEACVPLRWAHIGVCSDNTPTVAWQRRWASKRSKAANRLLRAMALRLRVNHASPLVTRHIAGDRNALGDIPSRSFGSVPEWHCETDEDLRSLMNARFPLPNQQSWSVFRPSFDLSMKLISVLRMRPSTTDAWRRLPRAGKHVGTIGAATSHLWEWTLGFRELRTPTECDASAGLPTTSAADATAEAARLQLQQSVALSRPLARRSLWTTRPTPRK